MKIAIAIPTYNEKENVSKIIDDIFALNIIELEIIFIDDNSPDGTGNIISDIAAKEKRVHLIRRPKKMGLGTAYAEGFSLALEKGAEFIFGMDADFSHDPKMIPIFLEKIKSCDVVIGSRYKEGVRTVNWPLSRLILSIGANKYVRLVCGLKFTDLTGGFNCFKRAVIESINLGAIRSNGYSFQIEIKYLAHKNGFLMEEIPIIFIERQQGKSKMSYRIIMEAFFIVWKLKFKLNK